MGPYPPGSGGCFPVYTSVDRKAPTSFVFGNYSGVIIELHHCNYGGVIRGTL